MTISVFIIAIVMSLLSLSACDKAVERSYPVIELPVTQVLTLETNWGLITSTFLRLRENSALASSAVTTLWQGAVVEILSQTSSQEEVEGRMGYWYRIQYDGFQGWVFGGYLRVYSSQNEAERAAREVRN